MKKRFFYRLRGEIFMHQFPPKPNDLQPIVHPTNHHVNHVYETIIIPHFHPSHTTTVKHINYQHVHFNHPSSEVPALHGQVPYRPLPVHPFNRRFRRY